MRLSDLNRPALPSLYLELLQLARPRVSDDGRFWMGEAGFRVGDGDQSPNEWLDQLAGERWPGMHPDLIPFALDGLGNRFCFYRSPRPSCRGIDAVVFWTYETGHAIPVAASFDEFVDWLALVARWTALRGSDPVVDDEHVEMVVAPVLRALGRSPQLLGRLTDPNPSFRALLRTVLEQQPRNPACQLARAVQCLESGDTGSARLAVEAALETFPEFTLARVLLASTFEQEAAPMARLRALHAAILSPMAFAGEDGFAWLGPIPALDPAWLAEELATAPLPADEVMFEPVWDLIQAYDPSAASGWLTISVNYADADDIDTAVTMAANALLFALPEERPPVLDYLAELYAARRWSWQASMVRAEAERLREGRHGRGD